MSNFISENERQTNNCEYANVCVYMLLKKGPENYKQLVHTK